MRFIERMIMGLGYHRRMHLLTFLLAAAFTGGGLFFQTNLMIENQTAANFTRQLNQFPANAVSKVASTEAVIKNAHALQRESFLFSFWVIVAIFVIGIIILNLLFSKKRAEEIHAYLIVGKSPTDIAAQGTLESLIAFISGFAIVALVTIICAIPIVKWIKNGNVTGFSTSVSHLLGQGHHTLAHGLSSLFTHRVTTFNTHGLLFGSNNMDNGLNTLAGYSITFFFGTVTVIIGTFIANLLQAVSVRRKL